MTLTERQEEHLNRAISILCFMADTLGGIQGKRCENLASALEQIIKDFGEG